MAEEVEDQFAHYGAEVPDDDDGKFPIESERPSRFNDWLDDRFDVEDNNVVCGMHYGVFLLVCLLAGAGLGTLLAILVS